MVCNLRWSFLVVWLCSYCCCGVVLQNENGLVADSLEVQSKLIVDSVSFATLNTKISKIEEFLSEIYVDSLCRKLYGDVEGVSFVGGYEQHCYLFFPKATWLEANSSCHALDMALVEINDAAENEFLTSFSLQHSNFETSKKFVLIGFYAPFGNHTYVWESEPSVLVWNGGSTEKYSNWYTGEPNSLEENCGNMFAGYAGAWNDVDCDRRVPYICERPLPASPFLFT
eukprot:GCRY01002907.1.p1 GENE.GCRY01002907.1~~GCRY01002907.1.p1  ORF type:complete len:227 (+),score=3.65 GCRY01002907.1:129-809(+)